ncbi:Dihydrodipicolinate synthase [Indibacter alkaliphilus LW1]|jgi:4-hydroxy-tetrahydrodipicolinate synthase|uniref:4-hydroxy-tetrahydrodipicolinate synthase n=1 Tax=Indibacter alkaliphilus (strain CCUG 57479 / KCTC 22604 / LW1) TaxID=1189612 RepID=S2D8K7_INDAL|nr:4-hydroxy-tetrahydrodipicolinate synthase [Indibacter alkaliphilus]EOZ95537.1 Dihydrodipicolinate synthase [Indibacter alkaliphilus LW1]
MNRLKGTGVALITPFHEDLTVDFEGLKKVIDHVAEGGADYLVVLGTTGESATMSKAEKKTVLEAALKYNKGRLPIVYGIGGNNTQAVLEEISDTDFSGIDAILSVSPYYNKPSQAGIIAHYTAVADTSPVPVILYNVPGRTMSNVSYQTTLTLAKHANIIGMKEASGDLSQCMRIAAKMPEDFLLISGDDILTPSMKAIGGSGVISVLANAYPTIFKSICHGNADESREAAFKLLDINPYMYEESNPVGLKCLMNFMGLCGDAVRLPLMKASPRLKENIKANMIK